jgi:acyl-[acyl-carrier-protein]-phospholipid O-acyltransferase/long-chain-fatty-acid--[acyl-carrier-protein] ligase
MTIWGLIIAILGLVGALVIRRLPAVDPGRPIAAPWGVTEQVRILNASTGLWVPALCLAAFWALGAVAQLTITGMVIQRLGMDMFQAATVMVMLTVGIAVGAGLAPKIIVRSFPAGTPVAGALIAGGCLTTCAWLAGSATPPAAWSGAWSGGLLASLVEMVQRYPVIIALICGAGVGSGLWVVSLNTLIQQRSRDRERAMVLAGVDILTNLGMILAFALSFGLGLAGWRDCEQLLFFGTASLAATVAIAAVHRHQILGWLVAVATFLAWRVRIVGDELVPRQGGCIVICNHTSFADGPILLTRLPRLARFLVFDTFFRRPLVGFALRAARCIPINGESPNRALVAAIRAATAAVTAGEMVALFPEGKISRSGQLDRFLGGVERIARETGVPIVPLHLDGLAGSFTSRTPRRAWPRLRRRVTLRVGPPLPPDTPREAIRQAVVELAHQTAVDEARRDRRTLAGAVLRRATGHPGTLAVADLAGPLSRIRLAAAALALGPRLGLAADERRVGVLLPTGRGGAIVNLALAIQGRCAVNLNHTVGEAGLRRMTELAGLRTIITAHRYLEHIGTPRLDCRWVDIETLLPAIPRWRLLAAIAQVICLPVSWLVRCRPDDPAGIIFSSGSTGDPKGIPLTHRQILANIDGVRRHLDLVPGVDRLLNPLPLFHSFGLSTGTWLPLVLGLPVIAHPDPTDARALGRLAETWRPTFMIATATFVRGYLRRIEPAQFASLRFAVVGAEKCPDDLRAAFRERYGAELFEGYGCTELGPVVSTNRTDVHAADGVRETCSRPGSVGRPLPGIAVVTIDPETRAPLTCGATGLLLVRSPAQMAGYIDRPDLSRAALLHGGYDTGDIGHVDEDGFVFITGRKSRFAKIGGEMVPMDLVEERILLAWERIAGRNHGIELAVAAIADQQKGERLLLLHTGLPDGLKELLDAADLPPLFRPKERDVYRVAAIPTLGTGKRDLRALREMAARLATAGPG